MNLESAKILLGVGLILVLIGGLLTLVNLGFVSIVGYILALIGAYGLAENYGNRAIFNNYLYSFITILIGIIAIIVVAIFFALSVPGLIDTLIFGGPGGMVEILISMAILIGVWLVLVASAWFEKRAYELIYEASGSVNFREAARFIWLGAIFTIVVVGVILWLIGKIFAIVGAFGLTPSPSPASVEIIPTPPVSQRPPGPPRPPSRKQESGETMIRTQIGSPLAFLITPDGKEIPILSPVAIFGREELAPHLPPGTARYVSGKHFKIYYSQGKWYIEDLDSTNGTIVNGQEIKGKGPIEIENGATIRPANIAEFKFKL